MINGKLEQILIQCNIFDLNIIHKAANEELKLA